MGYDPNKLNRILSAARGRDVAKVEELWLELQGEQQPLGDIGPFLDVAREAADRGDKDKAAELLLLLKDDLVKQKRDAEVLDLMRRAVLLSARVRGVREELVALYRKKHGGRSGFDAVLARSGLASEGASLQDGVKAIDQAFSFEVGDFVFHARGWGVGKVVEAHPESGEFVIDFARNRGARMEAGMALGALARRSSNDLDVMLWTDKDRVRRMAEEDALGLLKAALESGGGKVQSRDLKDKLEDVLDKNAWTKFWAKARKDAKEDPRIEIGPAPRSIISLREAPVSRTDEVTTTIRKLRGFEDVIDAGRRELANLRRQENRGEPPAWLTDVMGTLVKLHGKAGTPEHAAAKIELALFKDEGARLFPKAFPDVQASAPPTLDPDTGEVTQSGVSPIVKDALAGLVGDKLPPVLQVIFQADYRRRAVEAQSFCLARDEAVATLKAVLLDPAPQTWDEAVAALKRLGAEDAIVACAERIVVKPTDYPDAFVALARFRLNGRLDVLGDRPNAELLAKSIQLLDALALDHRGTSDRKEKTQLKATLDAIRSMLNEKAQRAIGQVIESGTEDQVRRILQLVRQSPAMTPTLIRATENFIVDRFPLLLGTVVAAPRPEETEQVHALYSTIEGKRRQEEEIRKIMDVELPKVTVEIGKALEFGDISENSELDAARERQQRLAEQVERMRQELERVQIIDPSKVETDEVRVGTRVTVEEVGTNRETTYTILGPWDFDESDPHIVSHLSPLATGLMGKAVGDEATVRLPDGSRANYRVKAIERAVLQQA